MARVVRPMLNALGHRRWSLGFAVETLLGRKQKDAHTAVGDAQETCDLMMKCLAENAAVKKKAKHNHEKEGVMRHFTTKDKVIDRDTVQFFFFFFFLAHHLITLFLIYFLTTTHGPTPGLAGVSQNVPGVACSGGEA